MYPELNAEIRTSNFVFRRSTRRTCCSQTRRGFTLVELAVTVIIMGSLVSFAVPRYFKAIEQTNVDLAATNLVSLWTAQRMYWVDKGTFATSISQLVGEGLLDSGFSPGSGGDSIFTYAILTAGASNFSALATRAAQPPTSYWSGSLTISETGAILGQIDGGTPIKHTLTPPLAALGM